MSNDAKSFVAFVVMVSGGMENGVKLDSVELLNMDGTWNCPMPPMPEARSGHTQSGRIACGGWDPAARKSCVTFFNGGEDWVKTHNLTQQRRYHSSWASPRGVMLMGGLSSVETTEILTGDGVTTPGFSLDYKNG